MHFNSYDAFISPKPQLQKIGNMFPTYHSKSIHRYKSLNSQISNENNIDSETEQVSKEEKNNWGIIAFAGAVIAIPVLMYITTAHGTEVASTLTVIPSAIQSQKNIFDPSQFQPVCPASDGVYQVLKLTANGLVGQENVVEYGPLIASVLLRIRLELCVLESFLYEAVLPFIQKKGLSWVLPLHETVETFLAGTIFAIASNFILLGSTKIFSIILIYADAITGMPTRFVGGLLKKLPNNSVGETTGKVLKFYGDILGGLRGALEAGDTFVGRYLVIATTIYIAFKFAHFKLFNDLFPF